MKPLCNAILVMILAFSLAVPAGFAAPQSQQSPTQPPPPPPQTQSQPQTQDQQPAATDQSSTTGQSQPSQTQDQTTSSDDEDKAPTKVKAGSEKDVNSIGNRGVGKGVNLYSLEREIALGKQAAMEVEKSAKMINDPVVTEYVNRIGQNLVRNSDAKVPFTIKVIDSDEINAFALPGGFFYVNSGLILRADEEAELAGVMGHEIAHVAARHGTRNATKGELAQFATLPLLIFGPVGWAGYGIYEGLNIAIPLGFLKFSRDDEREADYLGLQYMYKAGYDPNAFVSFFEKIEAEEKRHPGSIPRSFPRTRRPPTAYKKLRKRSRRFFRRGMNTLSQHLNSTWSRLACERSKTGTSLRTKRGTTSPRCGREPNSLRRTVPTKLQPGTIPIPIGPCSRSGRTTTATKFISIENQKAARSNRGGLFACMQFRRALNLGRNVYELGWCTTPMRRISSA